MSDGRTQFQISYELSPIILVGGIAATMSGGMLPILAVLQSQDFTNGILSGPTADVSYGNTFATFRPMTGGTLIVNQIGQYPFANQTVAANAIIAQPINISMIMDCSPRQSGDLLNRQAVISNLKQTLDNHTKLGGYYAVATPGYLYQNLVLLGIRDITGGETKNSQTTFQWDFVAPLITQEDQNGSTNSLMTTLQNFLPPGTPQGVTPSWSGLPSTIGSFISGATGIVIPSASGLIGAAAVQAKSVATGLVGRAQSSISNAVSPAQNLLNGDF
jgi:hypothetical protein